VVGGQNLATNQPELRRSRAVVGNVGCKRRDAIASGKVREVERK